MIEEVDTSLYNFKLPKNLIAQIPQKHRSEARLLFYDRKKDKISHLVFKDLVEILDNSWCVVLNDTKVEKRKVYLKKPTGGMVALLITDFDDGIIKCLPYKRLKMGQVLCLPSGEECVVTHRDNETYELVLNGNFTKQQIQVMLEQQGVAPLPPYIKRKYKDPKDKIDLQYYQTVFARNGVSLAAPTAGLHFTENIITELVNKGIKVFYITLNIGLSTFKPIKTDKITEHKLLPEYTVVPENVAVELQQHLQQSGKILCVGTTVVRTLEFLATKFGKITPYNGPVDIYIYPGYKFKVVSGMITNFHLPKSTNLVLVAAFVGRKKLLEIYDIAIQNNYKFYSYGDAMLII